MIGIIKSTMSFGMFAIPILSQICMFVDGIIYKVADLALQAFFDMAKVSSNVSAYSAEINYIINRVMVLAGVYALFRVAVMLINYLVDPDKISEFTKNGASFIKNIVIAVIMIILSPIIFNVLGDFQGLVISQRVIPKIIYGVQSTDADFDDYLTVEDPVEAKKFVNNAFLMFFLPNADCSNSSNAYYCEDYNKVAVGYQEDGVTKVEGISYLLGYASSSDFDYTPFVSGIFGMFLCYYFIVFTLELAVRIIKLVILQIISPIPIIMSIDPSQKNRLSSFWKLYAGIYMQIFFRILTLYLAFVVLSLLLKNGLPVTTGSLMALPLLVRVLLYVGVFQAAKEIPKLLEDAIGVKLGNPPGGKSFLSVLGGIVGGSAGLVGGTVAGAVSGGLGGAVVGGFSGMKNGAIGFATSKNIAGGIGKTVGSIKGSYATGAKVAGAGGLGMFMAGGVENFFGGKGRDASTVSKFDKDIADVDKRIEGVRKQIDVSNQATGLRNNLNQVLNSKFETRYGSLADRFKNDEKLNQLKSGNYQQLVGPNGQPIGKNQAQLIKDRQDQIEREYNQSRAEFFNSELSLARSTDPSINSKADESVIEALKDYNDFVDSHNLGEDRKIKSYEDFSTLDFKSKDEIRKYNANIQSEEATKKSIEQEKKDFQSSNGYVRRNKRDEKPNPKPRN